MDQKLETGNEASDEGKIFLQTANLTSIFPFVNLY